MEREQILKVMIPVGGFAILLLIVGAIIAITNIASTPSTEVAPPPTEPNLTDPNAPQPKFDKFPLDGPEWKDLEGGLKYWDYEIGTGETCPSAQGNPGLIPYLHYSGWLMSGLPFDTSRAKGKPLDYPFGRLIEGWKLGVPGMKVGGKRRLLIPSHLGYGAQGQGVIPGNATLIFELELIQLK